MPGTQVAVLAIRRLDSAAAGDSGACLTVCFTLVVSCAPEAKSPICDCLVCLKTHTHIHTEYKSLSNNRLQPQLHQRRYRTITASLIYIKLEITEQSRNITIKFSDKWSEIPSLKNKRQTVSAWVQNISVRIRNETMALVLQRPTAAVSTTAAELLTAESRRQLHTQTSQQTAITHY